MNILFPLIVTIFFAMVHYLGYTRVVKHLHVNSKTKGYLKFFLHVNMLGIAGYLLSRYTFNPPKELYFLLSLSIGVGFVIFIGTILYEILHVIQRNTPFKTEKRAFFKRSSDLGFLALGSAYLGAGVYEGSKEAVINHINVKQNRFNGKSYTIVQISDMHIGGLIDKEFVKSSVAKINALRPDLITITGDLSDAHVSTISEIIDELKNLKSRFGTFYVVGNHEYFHGIEDTIEHLKTLDIHVLENSSAKVDNFYIAGVYDIFGFRAEHHVPDINAAMQDIPKNAPSILLVHQPKYLNYLQGFTPSLILSGHTHGGQIWPFGYLVKLAQPYLKGLHSLGKDRHIYVNSGIGFWGPKMRLGSQAEITCISWS
ncbi:MAG: metallophosphoesterase [Campylobacterota bacterium]|nr:metallophosphoesterase [Campylobacterota bacterium]